MKYSLVAILVITFMSAFSQNLSIHRIEWQKPISETVDNKNLLFYNFIGASYDENFFPVYSFRVEVPLGMELTNAIIENPQYSIISEEEKYCSIDNSKLSENIKINIFPQVERKKTYALISFIPICKRKNNGIEKLTSFNVSLIYNPISGKKENKTILYSDNSVLSSGKWVKIKLAENGIYKITYDDLTSMGFSNPSAISVFGNGGKMLPLKNNIARYDDLVQNPVVYKDANGDGTFNNGDYILFYGQSPNSWTYDTTQNMYFHSKNRFSDYSYYFINDSKPVKTIGSVSSLPSGNVTVNSFDDYNFIERDSLNLINSGSVWYGSCFDIVTTYDYSFSFNNIITSQPLKSKIAVAARSSAISNFSVYMNGQNTGSLAVSSVNVDSYTNSYAADASGYYLLTSPNTSNTIRLSYNKPNSSAIGWLNYITVNVRRSLSKVYGKQLLFRDMNSVGAGNISTYTISNAGSNLQVWDITDPLNPFNINPSSNDGNFIFNAESDTLRQFVAFDDNSILTPAIVGEVSNQNLHSLSKIDFVIVCHPEFREFAEQLATHHREKDNLSVIITNPQEVYNEFSSGSPDVASIRDLMRMLYVNAGNDNEKMPRYLLLFGDGSYDNVNTSSSNTNFILTYQSGNSLDPTQSYVSDDFFGLLDDNEGAVGGAETMDIGVGRLPVKSKEEAKVLIDKIINYSGNSTFGDWRNVLTFVGDDAEDVISHQAQSDYLANICDTMVPDFNIDKIFLDAFQQISTPVGARYPDVNTAIFNRLKKGTLIFNYTGHGNELGLAHEHVVTTSDIASWDNWNKLSVFITATCEFSRYDDPSRTSAGEQVLLSHKGGGIALFSTSRLVYSTPNFYLNQGIFEYFFDKHSNGEQLSFGDIMRLGKNSSTTGSSINKRNFVLLGDPALKPAIPNFKIETTSINGQPIAQATDTFKALSKVTITGKVVDNIGNTVSDFNGIIYPAVFDKYQYTSTRGNDGNPPLNYKIQNKILYRGKASVKNGLFSFTFIVPKDISYTVGNGKISYYADNSIIDAAGNYKEVKIGGSSDVALSDTTSPEVKLFMNDENFVFGGITDPNPLMIATIIDSSGVNTVGNGIGHDITAVLDGNTSKAINLNDYYESDLDSYQKGRVNYDFTNLGLGNHNLKLKVWDVNNNSSEAYIEFIVASDAELVLDHIFNYPNPFTTQTSFYFDHNQPNANMEVLIQIFTVTGKLVKTLEADINTAGFRSTPIQWDGLDDYGDKIGKGVYIYKLKVKPQNGKSVEKFEKLVILR